MSEQTGWSSDYRDLWHRFSHSNNQLEYCQGWLDLQCARIQHARRGVLVLRTGEQVQDSFSPVARWPADQELSQPLVDLADRVIEEEFGLVSELETADASANAAHGRYGVSYPLKIDQQIAGIVSIAVAADQEQELADAMEKLQWGVAWIELMIRRHQQTVLGSDLPKLKSTVEILAAVLAEARYTAASNTFVTGLAAAVGCERVSLGVLRWGRVQVKAVSHSAQFGKRTNLIRRLEAAMEEAVFQRTDIIFPQVAAGPLVTRDHAELAEQQGCGSIYTLPLFGDGAYHGALTLERGADRPFAESELETIRAVAVLSGAALRGKQLNDRPLVSKTADYLGGHLQRVFGGGHPRAKLLLVALLAVVAYFMVATDTYRVAADTYLEGAVRQAMVAPFEGYIESSEVRAGDRVRRGQILSKLDDRDLSLERLNWTSERSKLQRQHEEAVAKHDAGQARVLIAQLEQNQAQLSLVENRLARTVLRAPFDGLVVSGDLSQRLGGTVEQGEVLFEVAPLNAYRLILWVDEHEIAEIARGQRGSLVLKALSDERFEFTVERVTPITEARDGGNYFRVESQIGNVSPRLRPGMEGVGKVEIGERKRIRILTRPLLRWLKLQYWAWFA